MARKRKRTPVKVKSGGTAIHVGATPGAFSATCAEIRQILSIEKCGDEPKAEALRTLAKIHGMPSSLTISNNDFRGF